MEYGLSILPMYDGAVYRYGIFTECLYIVMCYRGAQLVLYILLYRYVTGGNYGGGDRLVWC